MNKLLPNHSVSQNLTLEEIKAYLLQSGWKREDYPANRLLVFRYYHKDDRNEPIHLVLPGSNDYGDWELRVKEALELLTFIERRPLEAITNEIQTIAKAIDVYDTIKMRILNDFTKPGSISLELAQNIVDGLRNLVATAAANTKDARPYYGRLPSIGKVYAKKFRFAHTFPGSFGFTIESPPLTRQENMFPEISEEIIPFERRVTEQIIRGLRTLNQAKTEDNLNLLIENYNIGLNSNMGQALLDMAGRNQKIEMEYSIQWAPAYPPSEDIRDLDSVKLNEKDYWFVQDAIQEWQRIEPRKVNIYGKIEILRSSSEKNQQRQVRIHTKLLEEGDINVRVSLGSKDYRLACNAHRDRRTVSIEGTLERIGRSWFLRNPHDFKVL